MVVHNRNVVTPSTSNDDILLNNKAFSRSNSALLQVKITQRVSEIALLGKFTYVQLRLFRHNFKNDAIT
ncbi:hypothetical protein PA25_36040 [Pseudoalteromonas sp. A25]|nr:hypothetical protein PA25_36040 [Pseudoalteromonas sp. A25]